MPVKIEIFMDDANKDSVKPKRRIRYKGKYPRRFEEKYKELNSEKYSSDVEKVIQSGKTPAGTHRPVCVNEVLGILKPCPGQVGLDSTLGFGGHTVELLKKIMPNGRLFAIDVDPLEIVWTEKRLRVMGYSDKELIIKCGNFAGISKLLNDAGGGFDFVLADLGVSSMQLDNPLRGFTFKREGPLDLRFNPKNGQSAVDLIRVSDKKQLEKMFFENSDEPYARLISSAVFKNRNKINTTKDLADVIVSALNKKSSLDYEIEIKKSICRVFQALRIEVNDEFSVLEQLLRNLPFCLKPKGRVAILSFHSVEDNRVMNFFEQGLREGFYSDISREPTRPSAKERYSNPRSKSALLRWAVKK